MRQLLSTFTKTLKPKQHEGKLPTEILPILHGPQYRLSHRYLVGWKVRMKVVYHPNSTASCSQIHAPVNGCSDASPSCMRHHDTIWELKEQVLPIIDGLANKINWQGRVIGLLWHTKAHSYSLTHQHLIFVSFSRKETSSWNRNCWKPHLLYYGCHLTCSRICPLQNKRSLIVQSVHLIFNLKITPLVLPSG